LKATHGEITSRKAGALVRERALDERHELALVAEKLRAT
jgi:hypothetical protein